MRQVFLPSTLDELWQLLAEEQQDAALFAGGTDLLVRLRNGMVDASVLVSLERIDELKGVRDLGDEVFIGACTTHTRLLADPLIREHFPVLAKAINVLGSPQIRNMGTIGGNLVTASPAGDTLPPLYVLGAEVELKNRDSSRRVAINDFIRGPGETILGPGEILTSVWLRKNQEYNLHHYEKVGQRKALAIAVVSFAAVLNITEDGFVKDAKLAWGSVGPTVVTCADAEDSLVGRPSSRESLEQAADLARSAVRPIDDVRASAGYRRQVAGNLVLRLLEYKMRNCSWGSGIRERKE